MNPTGGTKPSIPPSGQLTREFFNRQVDAQRASIAQHKRSIRRWTQTGEDVKDEERVLSVEEKRLRRLLRQRQKIFTILAREADNSLRKVLR